jgi:hypothetical protein
MHLRDYIKPMKSIFTLIFLLVCILTVRSQTADSGSFILKGRIIGRDTGYVYLWYRGLDGPVSDSFHLNRGAFTFQGRLWEPTGAIFSSFSFASDNREKYDPVNLAELFIEPGRMSLLATMGNIREACLTGSRSDSDRVRLLRMQGTVEAKIQPVMRVYDVLAPLYNAEFKKDPKSEKFIRLKSESDSISALLKPLYAEEAQIDSAFIENNPSSYFAASMLLRNVSSGSTDLFRI